MLNYIPWILLSVLYSPVVFQLYRARWQYVDYTHAYFILPVSLFLAWLRRKRLGEILSSGAAPACPPQYLALLILGIVMYVFGWRKDYLFVSTFSLIPLIFGLCAYLYGSRVALALRFPILYLVLLVPPPLGVLDAVTLPMRYGVSQAAYLILRSINLPVTREGLMLSIEGQQLFMGPACSGFRSLITSFSLGLAYAYLSKAQAMKKKILVLSIIPLALLGNLIRVIMLCLIAFYFGKEAAMGFFHNASGIVIFIIVILGLLGIEAILRGEARPD